MPSCRVGFDRGFDGSAWVENSRNIYAIFCLLENFSTYSDSNLSVLTDPCNAHFTVFNLATHYILKYIISNNIDDLNTVFENATSDVFLS